MKYIILVLFMLTAINTKASEPMRIGVITDTHYLSEELMDGDVAVEKYMQASARDIKYVPAVLDTVFSSFVDENGKANIDILLVTGDMTKDGERQSHIDFARKLEPLKEKGVRIFVIPGNHDINVKQASIYLGSNVEKVPSVSFKEFEEIYTNYGFSDAIKRDTASLSYVAELDKNTWLIAIDAAQYREGENSSVGKIPAETERWIIQTLEEAADKKIDVLGMMHWGLTEHFPHQGTLMSSYLVDEWQRLSYLFADKGLKVIFTGHFHANDITMITSPQGNKIYDIETGALCSYPFSYRRIEYTAEQMDIITIKIESVPSCTNLARQNKAKLIQVAEKLASHKLRAYGIEGDMNKTLSTLTSQLFLSHVAGDEVLTEDIKKSLDLLNSMMDTEEAGDNSSLQSLDFYPADNTLTIKF